MNIETEIKRMIFNPQFLLCVSPAVYSTKITSENPSYN